MRNYTILLALAGMLWPLSPALSQNCLEGNCENGQGTLEFENGLKYVGQFKDGAYHGIGICYWPNGERYEGEWRNGKPHGKGNRLLKDDTRQVGWFEKGEFVRPLSERPKEMVSKGGPADQPQATGCISGNCQNGRGVFVFDNGAIYTGEFREGEINGYGICHYPDGSRYEGGWRNAQPDGNGKMIGPDGLERTGKWRSGNMINAHRSAPPTSKPAREVGCQSGDCINGKGEIVYIDGSHYRGYFRDSKPHGQGIFTYPNQEKYEGSFKNGVPHGRGILYQQDGSTQKGHWMDGEFIGNEPQPEVGCISGNCQNGNGIYLFEEGDKYIGTFKAGLPHGEGTVFYTNGQRYEGEMADGYLHGYGTLFYRGGKKVSGYWEDGVYQPEQPDAPSPAPEPQRSAEPELQVWAVVIGVASYNHMPVLRYPDDDAYRMYAFLKSPEGGALDDEHIKILVDEEATRGNIKRVMSDIFGKAGPNDLIMLYYSGHGVNGAFLPYDFDHSASSRLMHQEIMNILNRSRAKHKLCIADACYSGSLLASKGPQPRDGLTRELYNKISESAPSTALIVSSKYNETSVESSGLRQGVFSHYLIRGLKGEADTNRDRYINVTELFQYVRQNVRDYTGNRQSPMIEGDYDPGMPVSIRR